FLLFCLHCSAARRSLLFPYTTLFRSLGAVLLADAADDRVEIGSARAWLQRLVGELRVDRLLERRVVRDVRPGWFGRRFPFLAERDRKSTRLNSSHVKISYAVFCSKQK